MRLSDFRDFRYPPSFYLIYQSANTALEYGHLLVSVPRKFNSSPVYRPIDAGGKSDTIMSALIFLQKHHAEQCVEKFLRPLNHSVEVIHVREFHEITDKIWHLRHAEKLASNSH